MKDFHNKHIRCEGTFDEQEILDRLEKLEKKIQKVAGQSKISGRIEQPDF